MRSAIGLKISVNGFSNVSSAAFIVPGSGAECIGGSLSRDSKEGMIPGGTRTVLRYLQEVIFLGAQIRGLLRAIRGPKGVDSIAAADQGEGND